MTMMTACLISPIYQRKLNAQVNPISVPHLCQKIKIEFDFRPASLSL